MEALKQEHQKVTESLKNENRESQEKLLSKMQLQSEALRSELEVSVCFLSHVNFVTLSNNDFNRRNLRKVLNHK